METTDIITEICDEHGVQQAGDNAYTVTGSTGNVYTVRLVEEPDHGVRVWQCDCTAARHGRECKHYRAAIAANGAILDELGRE